VPAAELLEGVRSILPSPVELALDGLRHRLLLTGTAPDVACATEAARFLDVALPSAQVEVTMVETARRRHDERGGHGLFDRDGSPAGPDTFFRSLRFDFEPETWLRSELTGESPFEGSSLRGARSGTGGPLAGTVDLLLRGLAREGEAEILSSPSIVVTEGVPAVLQSTLELPVGVFTRDAYADTYGVGNEHAGVRLELVAQRIGNDALVLSVHPWLRELTELATAAGPAGAPTLAVRELSTTVTMQEDRCVLLGGVEAWTRAGAGAGLPLPPALAALTSTLGSSSRDTRQVELVFCVRARILHPGRDDARMVPPCERARRDRIELAGRIPPPRPR